MRDPYLLDSIVEELLSEEVFESANKSFNNSSFSTGASMAKKQKSTADVLERDLQIKAEAKSEIHVLKLQKAAACQLKSYCLGMNQLMELSQKSTGTLTSDQSELMARMSNTIGIAVSAMESHHIKSGTIRCPQSETEVEKTPESGNSSGNNNKGRRTGSPLSQTNSIAQKLLDSKENDFPITNDSPLSEESFPSLDIAERDFLTADGGESTNTCESGTDITLMKMKIIKKMLYWIPLFEGNRSNQDLYLVSWLPKQFPFLLQQDSM